MIRVLFVCLGNICRSPLAEGIFNKLVSQRGLSKLISCDSAGTSSYHIGSNPDHRSCSVAKKYEIVLDHKARQFYAEDFSKFDYIIAMDESNYSFIRKLKKEEHLKGSLHLMRTFDIEANGELDVPDPYYKGQDGFEHVYHMLQRCCDKFLDFILTEQKIHVTDRN